MAAEAYNEEDYLGAREHIEKAMLAEKPNANTYCFYGNILYKLGLKDSAFHYFQKSYLMDGLALDVNFQLAMMYHNDLGKDSLALYHIDKELTKRSADVYILELRSSILTELGRMEQAEVVANELVRMAPESPEGYLNLGIICFRQKDYECALHNYTKAIQRDSMDIGFYSRRATTYASLNQYDSALLDVNRMFRLDSNSVDGYYLRYNIYVDMGRYDEACEDLYMIQILNPKHSIMKDLPLCE